MATIKKFFARHPMLPLLIPAALLIYFVYVALGWNLWVSVSDWEPGSLEATYGFAGFKWYIEMFKDDTFWISLKNTLLLFSIIPICLVVGLLLALLMDQGLKCTGLFRTLILLPFALSYVVTGTVWAWMYNPSYGIINNVLGVFGVDPINWINAGSGYWANMAVLTIYIVWNALPFKILILLGGLQGINKQYYDAAKVDSTPRVRVFTKITVPLLSPMLAYVVITGFIGGFKEYSSIVGIFGDDMQAVGGASLNTMVGYIYDALGNREGRASAAALILFAIIFVVTMINLYVSKKKTHY